MPEYINIDISDESKSYNKKNMNVNKKITWLYDDETLEGYLESYPEFYEEFKIVKS